MKSKPNLLHFGVGVSIFEVIIFVAMFCIDKDFMSSLGFMKYTVAGIAIILPFLLSIIATFNIMYGSGIKEEIIFEGVPDVFEKIDNKNFRILFDGVNELDWNKTKLVAGKEFINNKDIKIKIYRLVPEKEIKGISKLAFGNLLDINCLEIVDNREKDAVEA